MDDPRLSNYFASTEASGKNRYGSSREAARGISWVPSMAVDRQGPVGGESSTSDRSKKFPRRGWDALSIFLFFAVRAARAARSVEAAHSSCLDSWNFPFLVGSSHEPRATAHRAEDTKRNCGAKHHPSRPLPPSSGRKVPSSRLEWPFLIYFRLFV